MKEEYNQCLESQRSLNDHLREAEEINITVCHDVKSSTQFKT